MLTDDRVQSITYKDEGCELASSCLGCPFKKCIKEEGGIAAELRIERNKKIVELWKQGMNKSAISRELGIDERTVYRALKGTVSSPSG